MRSTTAATVAVVEWGISDDPESAPRATMSPRPRNVELDRDFGARLRVLREGRLLSKTELAHRAGISAKSVGDLEAGKRKRAQENTLMSLAEALGMTFADLMAPGTPVPPRHDAPRRRWPHAWIVAVVIVAVAVAALAGVWSFARSHARWTVDDTVVTVRDGVLGIELWSLDAAPNPVHVFPSPWTEEEILVGLSGRTEAGGVLQCRNLATGKILWEVRPDVAAVVRAFGEDIVLSGNFSCTGVHPVDFAGDGEPEALVTYCHSKYYPMCLCTVDREGNLLAQYSHRGHLTGVVVYDLDGDGHQEVLATGTNNAPAYQGATVLILDEQCRHGASVDSLCNPESGEPDSARVRLVLPLYPEPWASHMPYERLHAVQPQIFRGRGGDLMISVMVGYDPVHRIIVYLDGRLHPRGSDCTDGFLETMRAEWPDSLWQGTGPADPAWRAAWLATAVRFEAGHRP